MKTNRSKEEMYQLVAEYLSGKVSQKAFSQAHGIPSASFSYWVSRYRREKEKTPPPSDFIKIVPLPATQIEVIYPNGVLVRVPAEGSVEVLRTLIQLG